MLSTAEQIQELEQELQHLILTPAERAEMSRELEGLRAWLKMEENYASTLDRLRNALPHLRDNRQVPWPGNTS
jgi:hypothetical protein